LKRSETRRPPEGEAFDVGDLPFSRPYYHGATMKRREKSSTTNSRNTHKECPLLGCQARHKKRGSSRGDEDDEKNSSTEGNEEAKCRGDKKGD